MKTNLPTSYILGLATVSIVSLCHGQLPNQPICPQALSKAAIESHSGSANSRHGMAFSNGRFVAVNPDGQLQCSGDGVEWQLVSVPINAFVRGVAFGNNQFVAVGGSYVGRPSIILTSSNGRSWQIARCPTQHVLRAVAYGDGRFVAVGDAGVIIGSRDGNRWRQEISGTEGTLAAVAFGNRVFVTSGEDGLLLSSNDGARWMPRNSGTGHYI